MRVKLAFLAPIPVGHEVLVQWTERSSGFFRTTWSEGDPILLDLTTGIVWCSWGAPEGLDHARFAVELHGKHLRQSRPMTSGQVRGCQVMTRGEGKSNHLSTTLEIEVTTEAAGPER